MSTGVVGLHHVQLAAPPGSEDALRWFYGEVPRTAGGLQAAGAGRARRGLVPLGELHLGLEEGLRPARKAHPGLLVDDLDGFAERLAAHGVEVLWDGTFPGYRRCYVADPHGNRLELLEPVSAPTAAPAETAAS